jgi:hypothetical protein
MWAAIGVDRPQHPGVEVDDRDAHSIRCDYKCRESGAAEGAAGRNAQREEEPVQSVPISNAQLGAGYRRVAF